jgi:hypothetical protein
MSEPRIEPTIKRDPVAGDLLVASIMLADGVFNQTVVLILDADGDGALGVILNEIAQTPLDAVLPDWVSAVSEPRMLFHGGPQTARSRQVGGHCSTRLGCCTWTPRLRSFRVRTGTCGSSQAMPGGQQASYKRRSPKACGTWRRPTIATSSAVNLSSYGVLCYAGSAARLPSFRPGWRIPS